MSFAKEASKLFTNKYFLYFMVFLASTNMLGYLVTNKINAVIFFALVSLLTYQFSKNMSVILLVAIIATNFLMANKSMREGLDNPETTEESPKTDDSKPALNNIDAKDKDIADNLPKVKASSTVQQISSQTEENKRPAPSSTIVDPNNPDKNAKTNENEPVGAGTTSSGKKGEKVGPRLDYAATIEESYANLDNLLGSDAISKLSNDTQKLMSKQQQLFDTMQNMTPMLQQAQSMLKGFDIKGLQDSLKGIGGLDLGNVATIAKAN